MKKFKEILINISKRIKKSNLVRLIKSKSIIKDLNDKIGVLEKEKHELNNEIRALKNEVKELTKIADKVPSLELVVESSDKSIKEKMETIKELDEKRVALESQLFETNLELSSIKIQIEEYENQIKELKSNRYLVRKIPSGRTPNTVKTKVSKPMSARVTKYMREEHE